MKLSDYLTQQNLSGAEFARRNGISEGMVSLLCRGETWLSKEMAQKIIRATDGAVTPTDFLPVEAAQ